MLGVTSRCRAAPAAQDDLHIYGAAARLRTLACGCHDAAGVCKLRLAAPPLHLHFVHLKKFWPNPALLETPTLGSRAPRGGGSKRSFCVSERAVLAVD